MVKKKLLKTVAIAFLICLAIVGITYAATYIITTNSVDVVVTDPQMTATLARTPTGDVLTGAEITFTVQVNKAVSGLPVTLFDGAIAVGGSTTDASGMCVFTWVATVGTHTFTANVTATS